MQEFYESIYFLMESLKTKTEQNYKILISVFRILIGSTLIESVTWDVTSHQRTAVCTRYIIE